MAGALANICKPLCVLSAECEQQHYETKQIKYVYQYNNMYIVAIFKYIVYCILLQYYTILKILYNVYCYNVYCILYCI
jgi:hypothetical protein